MAEDYLATRPSLFVRILRSIGILPTGEVEFVAGADYSAHNASEPGYPKGDAMSAFAAFPFVYACVDAIASDLSGLPLRAVRGSGESAQPLDSHPALDLFASPSTRVSSGLFRRQMITDYILTGDAYALIAGEREPQAILRMAPQRVRVIPWTDGQPGSYEYDRSGETARYSFDEVMHIRSPSWEDDPSSLYGTGAIRPLDTDLRTEQASILSAQATAKIGRPSGIISPSEDGDRRSKEQIARMRAAYEKQLKAQSGVLFLGGAASFQQLAWSPRDLEFQEQRKMTREAVLATFSVPPTRVGLPSANFATAREQNRMYWTTLIGRSRMIDVELSRIAKMFPGSDNVSIYHDFAEVESLQESRTERVDRVRKWFDMGLSLSDAASLEGFDEMPDAEFDSRDLVGDEVSEEEEETIRGIFHRGKYPDDEEDEKDREVDSPEEVGAVFRDYYDDQLEVDSYPVPTTRAEREAVWRSYIDRLHKPAERAIRKSMSKFLDEQSRRINRRFRRVANKSGSNLDGRIVLRSITDDEIEEILESEAEKAALAAAMGTTYSRTLTASFALAARQMGDRNLEWNPIRRGETRLNALSTMSSQVQRSTDDAIRALIRSGLDRGLSIDEISLELQSARIWEAPRAMRIARTEATRITNAGSLDAMDEMRDLGLTVYKMWDTAGDMDVRDDHADLDGVYVLSDELFNTAVGPIGQPATSGDPGFDVNCRCNLIPFMDEGRAEDSSERRRPFREKPSEGEREPR